MACAKSMRLEAGEVISGTLRLTRKIADGGMGSVWIAEHLVLGTEVAVKFMSGPWGAVPTARTRFLREARMTAHIASPHVVRALDCRMTEGDEPYLVLELLHGETLDQRVRAHGPLSVFDVVEIVSQTCEALAATHEAGIIHRDVKPENVFLVAGSTTFVKLIDFGVAKPKNKDERLSVDDLAAGTPQYMSPEHVFDPESTDERSDLFSLGAVAYFALTHRSPFEADSLEGLYLAMDRAAFRPPSELRPELPESLDAWFAKALASEPRDRFADARSMAAALYEAVREAREGRATHVDPIEAAAGSPPGVQAEHGVANEASLASLSDVPGVSMMRPTGARKVAVVALALAAALGLFVWRSGLDLKAAVASEPAEVAAAKLEPKALEAVFTERTPPVAEARPRGRAPAPAAHPNLACEGDDDVDESEREILGSLPNPEVAR
jgi:serine/threonine-protein kinase